ncbi:uncharacterized protein [Watersipora subatra]|uniref:uncharacterized protein isoform X2 n=1 Tax=Watersipora subatra TaxID=2589382 RepID=UPI00355B5005
MSLETLLEAAEFLEWNKPGKKSRATRTSKKAEKSKPSTNTERKRKAPPSRPAVTDDVQPDDIPPDDEDAPVASSSMDGTAPLTFSDAVAVLADDLIPEDSEDDEDKIIMRDLRRSIGSRETHNKLEKNRRAHLKECFELLRCELPSSDERKSSNLSTLRSALRLIEHLNNKQKELESERRRMTKLKNSKLAQINSLKKELSDKGIDYNIDDWIEVHHTSTNSTNTASECGDPTPENLPKEAVGPKPKLTVHTASPSEVKLMLQGEPKLGIIAPVSGKTKSNVVQAALNVEPQAPASPSQVSEVERDSWGYSLSCQEGSVQGQRPCSPLTGCEGHKTVSRNCGSCKKYIPYA